jgi:hypothetical protein
MLPFVARGLIARQRDSHAGFEAACNAKMIAELAPAADFLRSSSAAKDAFQRVNPLLARPAHQGGGGDDTSMAAELAGKRRVNIDGRPARAVTLGQRWYGHTLTS